MFLLMFHMNLALPFVLNFALLQSVSCFNLDLDYPIIYETPYNETSSYFGYSVSIRPKASFVVDSWTIQIGAPRSNVEEMNVKEPGTIYRCETHGPCQKFLLDKNYNNFGGKGPFIYKDKKDEAWIGGSMDIQGFDSHEISVVCGHRWINQNLKNPEKIDVTYLMTGICYLQEIYNISLEAPVLKLLPLVNIDKIYTPKPYVVDLSTYHWGLGEAGISVKWIGDHSNLVIGAPGVTHWVGSVIWYDTDFRATIANFAKTEISRKNRYTYVGYSVDGGKFYKDQELWFVAGAPRSANYKGEVYTFQYHPLSDNIYIQTTLTGTTFGEYFGASLGISDVNGDGFDDLIVGAPLYSNKEPDEGRIYVFLGNSLGNFLSQSQIISGQATRGRFGSCITSLNDMDQNGFMDVAVGAPYEDEGRGVIYIYQGYVLGLRTEHSQRIRAQDIHPHLRGFGISISRPVDVDGNKYLDIGVGAYLSGHVVLLRSRPVVSLHPRIKTEDIPLIDRRDSHVNISFCLRYSGSNAPRFIVMCSVGSTPLNHDTLNGALKTAGYVIDILEETQAQLLQKFLNLIFIKWYHADSIYYVLRVIEIDPLYNRASIEPLKKIYFFKKSVRIISNEILCEVYPVYLNLTSKNYSPLQINLKTELTPCSKTKGEALIVSKEKIKESGKFVKWCPKGNSEEISKELAFAGICGSDYVCRSDIQLTCSVPEFRNWSYVIGSTDHLTLSLNIRNLGEPAQNVKIKIWSNLKLNRHYTKNIHFPEASDNVHWLEVDGTLYDNYKTNFIFRVPFSSLNSLKTSDPRLNLNVQGYTSSIDINANNNGCTLPTKFISDASVHLHSSSSLTTFFLSKKLYVPQIINFTHYYEIQKFGVSPLKESELRIYIPYFFGEKFLTFDVETSEWIQFSSHHEDSFLHPKLKEDQEAEEGATSNGVENCPPTNRTLFLNSSTPDNKSHLIKIYFNSIPFGSSSYVKIIIFLNTTAIDSIKGEKDIVYFSTSAVLTYSNFLSEEEVKIVEYASTGLYNEEIPLKVQPYIIALSVLAGGFLLSLVIACLAKNNFFKRIKKQELKALKEAEVSFVYIGPQSCTS